MLELPWIFPGSQLHYHEKCQVLRKRLCTLGLEPKGPVGASCLTGSVGDSCLTSVSLSLSPSLPPSLALALSLSHALALSLSLSRECSSSLSLSLSLSLGNAPLTLSLQKEQKMYSYPFTLPCSVCLFSQQSSGELFESRLQVCPSWTPLSQAWSWLHPFRSALLSSQWTRPEDTGSIDQRGKGHTSTIIYCILMMNA